MHDGDVSKLIVADNHGDWIAVAAAEAEVCATVALHM